MKKLLKQYIENLKIITIILLSMFMMFVMSIIPMYICLLINANYIVIMITFVVSLILSCSIGCTVLFNILLK